MSSSKFVSNLDGMNEGENFSKDLLKVKLLSFFLSFFVGENDSNFLLHLHFRVFTIP